MTCETRSRMRSGSDGRFRLSGDMRCRGRFLRALTTVSLAVVLAAATVGLAPAASAVCSASDAQCDLRERIAAADQYVATRPGTVGFVLRDRATGARYRNANAGTMIWTASTIKLAMVADLLTREE